MGAEGTGLRVLMTTDTVGGVWSYAVELARAFDRRGIEVHLATLGAPVSSDQRTQLLGLRALTLHESCWALEWMERPWHDVDGAGKWLLELERRIGPHLVHLNQFSFGALPFAAPTLLAAHSCVLSWWRAVHGQAAPASWDEYRHRVVRGLAGADLVVAPTRAMLDSLAENYGYVGRGQVICNGRSAEEFRAGAKQPFIFAAGRFWDEAKNLAALRAVAPLLPWPVRIAGATFEPGKRPSPLPSPASGRGRVQFLGELPAQAVVAQLAQTSIYALPARYEPFGLSVLEAALSGCALVLGDIASLREVWGEAALYVAPDDYCALRATLCRLIEDAGERTQLADAAAKRARSFTSARMSASYLDAYSALEPAFAGIAQEEMQCA